MQDKIERIDSNGSITINYEAGSYEYKKVLKIKYISEQDKSKASLVIEFNSSQLCDDQRGLISDLLIMGMANTRVSSYNDSSQNHNLNMTIESNQKTILGLCKGFHSNRTFPKVFNDEMDRLNKTKEECAIEDEKIRKGRDALGANYLASLRASFYYPPSSTSTESSNNKMSPSS